MRKLNIVHICDHLGWPGSRMHGVKRLFAWMIPRFDRSRFNVSLISLRKRDLADDTLESLGIDVRDVSSVYETAPVGPASQAWFLNAVVAVDTSLDPVTLLQHTQAIERELGREPTYHWGPRTIDLDILLFGNSQVRTATLTIPHPELCRRATPLRGSAQPAKLDGAE